MKKFISSNPLLSEKDAQKIGRFIDSKYKGNITAKALLEEARDKESFLHKFFEWDDSVAAERYRLSQAKNLIVSIYIQADDDKPMRGYLRVNMGPGFSYVDSDQVKENQDLIDQVMIAANDQLIRWKDRYGRYCEYFELTFKMKGREHEIKGRGTASINPGGKQKELNNNHKRRVAAHGEQV